MLIKILSSIIFLIGSGLITVTLVGILLKQNKKRLLRSRRETMDFKTWYITTLEKDLKSSAGQRLNNKLRRAGYPMKLDIVSYRLIQISTLFLVTVIYVLYVAFSPVLIDALRGSILLYLSILSGIFFIPSILVYIVGSSRVKAIREELSKLSHRISICLTDKSDLRDVIVRASRTSKVLKPYVNEMLVRWNVDQDKAIRHFGDSIGIDDVLPLVNSLLATKTTKRENVVELFNYQIRNIDTTLDFNQKKKIEGTPLVVIILVMVPFLAVLILMLYPWAVGLVQMVGTSF